MHSSDPDSDCDSGSVTSNASAKRKASNDVKEFFKNLIYVKRARVTQAKPRLEENFENTSNGERWNRKEPHGASGLKNSLHGTIYQLKYLTLISNRARMKGCAFSLSTEMDDAEKFDDLVFEYEENPRSRVHRFMQMKHKLDEKKKITERDLLAEDDSDFSVLKYFISWRKIRKNPVFSGSISKYFFICTNIGLDEDKIDHNSMRFTKVNERDEFLEITDQEEQPPLYKLELDPKSKLREKLKFGSDLHQLAKALAQCVNNSKKLEIKGIFKRYHVALAREVFQIENKKARFSDNFIKGNCSSDTAKKFRDIFMDYFVKQSTSKKSLPPIQKIWQKLGSRKFTTSLKFGVSSGSDTLPLDKITDEEISTFLEEFILAVDQPNEDKLAEMIRHEFSNDSSLNLQNVNFLADSFQNKILDWFKSKQDIPLVNEDADKFFDDLQCQVSVLITAGVSSVYTAKLNKYDVRFKREIIGVVSFLSNSKAAKKTKLQLISSKKTVLTALRIWQTVKLSPKYKKKDAHIFVDLKDLLLPDIKEGTIATLKSARGPTLLIVDCESNNTRKDSSVLCRKLWSQLLQIVKNNTDARMIIMTHANDPSVRDLRTTHDALEETDNDVSIDKLEISTQQKLLNKKVLRIQGREEKISYARILGTDIFDNVDSEDCGLRMGPDTLVKLIKDEDIQIGDTKIMGWEEIKEYYVSRMIDWHVTIKVDVLMDPEINDAFALSGIDEDGLVKLLTARESFRRAVFGNNQLQPFHTNHYTILRNGQEKHDFEELCRDYSDDKIHWLQHELGKLILKQSFGSNANLMKYRDESEVRGKIYGQGAVYLTEDQLAEAEDKVVIISDTAGMGKSTILSRFEEMMRDKGILTNRVDLTQNTPALASELKERSFHSNNTDEAVEFLLKKLSVHGANKDSESCSTRKMMIKMRGEEAALLFDGFDEISPDYTEIVIELLQALAKLSVKKLFVTTRPNMSKKLENKLGVFSHTMQPFSRTDQEKFLTTFWRRELKKKTSIARPSFTENDLQKHARRLLDLLSKSIDRSMQEFTGIPLQTRMVAEIFIYGESKLPKKIKIIDLYDRFVDKKLNIFSDEKKRCDRTKPAVVESEMSMRDDWRKKHEKLALDALFDQEIVETLLKSRPDVSKSCETFADGPQAVLRLGIVDKITDKPHFIHRTFAEYFAANFLFVTLKTDLRNQKLRKIFVEQVFADSQYTTIRAFLNSFLADEKYVHPLDYWKFDLIKHRNAKGETAYHVAARERNLKIATFLVNKLHKKFPKKAQFSNINCPSKEGKTPLIVAVETIGNTDVVKCYVKAGANKESKTNEGETPLHLAISYPRRVQVAKYLIEQKANIEAKTKDGLTPLHLAAQSGNQDVVENLTKKGANINSQTNDGYTPLHLAAMYGKVKVVEHLVKKRAKVDSQNGDGKTPLHVAAECGKLDVVKYLVEKETEINSRDNEEKTPLHLAAKYNKLKVVEYLVKKEANIKSRDNEGKTPLHLAAECGKFDVVKHLIDKKADLNSQDDNRKTPLHLAIKDGKLAMVELLVEGGGNIDSQDKDEQTPLHLAIECGNLGLVTFLLTNDADIEAKNVNGDTPLHMAIRKRRNRIVGHLIKEGADVESKTAEGCTARDMMNLGKKL